MSSFGLTVTALLCVGVLLPRGCESNANPILILLQNLLNPSGQSAPFPPEYLFTKDLILKQGFDYENYEVPTADGYLLQLHRILVHKKKKPVKPPILINHGFLASSDIWLTRSRDKGFPFILADEGFDVWLGDFRGNFYSRAHQNLSEEDPAFWNFTLHEHAVFDIPALVDAVLEVTGAPKLFTVGHSMSGAVLLMTLSTLPDFADKIHANFLFAPAPLKVDTSVTGSPIVEFFLNNVELIKGILTTQKKLGVYEIMPRTAALSEQFKRLCGSEQSVKFCWTFMKIMFGDNPSNIDPADMTATFEHYPAGTSLKALWHMHQILLSGLAQFDYGSSQENIERYGSSTPSRYPLERIRSYLVIFHGDNDVFIRKKEVDNLTKRLTTPVKVVHVPDPKFSHADFVLGLNSKEILYKPIVRLMNSFNTNGVKN